MSRTLPKAFVTAAWSKNRVDAEDQARKYCKEIVDKGFIPVCPVLAFSGIFDENDADSDKKRREMSDILLKSCTCVFVCGPKRNDDVNADAGTGKRATMGVYELSGVL